MACQSNKSMDQLEPSTPALLAELIICQDLWTSIDRKPFRQALRHMCREHRSTKPPMPSDPVERWSELLDWRHPRMDLNLLQLAVIFDRKECVDYLWRPIFTREENYRDENAKLVNHPLHLACRLGHSSALEAMGDFADKILGEEGTVDLSQTRIQRSTSRESGMEPNNGCSSERETSLDRGGRLAASSDNELLVLMTRNHSSVRRTSYAMSPVVGTPISLIDKEDRTCVPLLFDELLMNIAFRLHTAQPSVVENLWSIVQDLSRRGLPADEFRVCMEKLHTHILVSCATLKYRFGREDRDSNGVHRNQVFHREVSILACQLLACVAEDTESFAASLKALWSNLITMAYFGEIEPMQKAASNLPKKHLPSLIIHLKEHYLEEYQRDPNSNGGQGMLSGVQKIKALAGDINLEHLCTLKILESVRGDARAARNLTALPEPLRERFHVPFPDLYDQITAESA